MKKTLSILLSFVFVLNLFSATGFNAMAETAKPAAPYVTSKKYTGKVLCKSTVYYTRKKKKTLDFTKANGKKIKLKKGVKITIIGKNEQNGKWYYIKRKINKKTCYGYISAKNVSVLNSKNESIKSVSKYNPYYKKTLKYNYVYKNSMPIYQFDQGNQYAKGKKINDLLVGYSCGPHTIAAALSALNGSIIFPEEIMDKMSRSALAPDHKGTSTETVISSVKPYIKSQYNLNFEYESIDRKQVFNYLKKGYFVILAVENYDGLALFTKNAHFILLAGYDDLGNVIVLNSNKRIGFLDSFSESRIKKNITKAPPDKDTLAIKWKYDDSYKKQAKQQNATLIKDAEISQHYNNYGKIYKLKAKDAVTVIGARDKSYYVAFKYNQKTYYGFINKESCQLS